MIKQHLCYYAEASGAGGKDTVKSKRNVIVLAIRTLALREEAAQ